MDGRQSDQQGSIAARRVEWAPTKPLYVLLASVISALGVALGLSYLLTSPRLLQEIIDWHRASAPVAQRMPAFAADGPGPPFGHLRDLSGFNRASRYIRDGDTYHVVLDPKGGNPVDNELIAAGRLYLPWAFPLEDPDGAQWLLVWSDRSVPPGLHVRHIYRFRGLRLLRLRDS